MPYTHFTLESRIKLEGFLDSGMSISSIAQSLQKTPASIYGEIKRNRLSLEEYTDCRVTHSNRLTKRPINRYRYSGSSANLKAARRRFTANQYRRKLDGDDTVLSQIIIKKLRKRWSPEQISGALRKGRIKLKGKKVFIIIAVQTIYDWIYRYHKELKKYLRHIRGYRHNRQYYINKYARNAKTMLRNISTRPSVVEERSRIGDWEGDTVLGKSHGATGRIGTLVERKTGYLVAFLLPPLSKDQAILPEDEKELARITMNMRFADGTVKAFRRRVIPKRVKTLTLDNGSENTGFEWIERAMPQTAVYFANPYHSWERGTNENTNGLLRQYFPKSMDFRKITPEMLDKAVTEINNRPRKRLNYRSPAYCMYHKNALVGMQNSKASN